MSRETIESQEFYNLMQTYRHWPIEKQSQVIEAYEAVKVHIERLLADEREPMKCGHPKACMVPEHFFIAMKPCNKPYDVYVCEICGQNMHKHTDGGGTAWIMKEYCSACAEQEKVRETCAEWMEHSVDRGCIGIVGECSCGLENFLQLDLTRLDEGEEEKV